MTRENQHPTIIIVLGMHRSGTSLAAQMISRWGAFMGDDLMPANEYNQEGYWEYNPLVNLNDKMLAFTGNTWYAPPLNVKLSLLLNTFGEEAQRLVDEMDESQTTWCWKDPRMAVLFPFWKEILKDRKIAFIVTNRHPLSVVSSLKKRDNMPATISLDLWEFYARNILSGIKNSENTLFLEYERMLEQPEKTSKVVFSFLNQAVGRQKELKLLEEMKEVIKPGLHHSKPTDDVCLNPARQQLISLLQLNHPVNAFSENENRLKHCYETLRVYNKSGIYREQQLNVQLFWASQKNEFEEKKSIIKKYNPDSGLSVFEFEQAVKFPYLRFDPLNDWLALSFKKLELFVGDEQAGTITKVETNAFTTIKGNLFFLSRDPQLFFDCSEFAELEITKVAFHVEYVLTGTDCKKYFADNPHLFFGDVFSQNEENAAGYPADSFKDLKSAIKKEHQTLLEQKDEAMQLKGEINKIEEVIEKERTNLIGQINKIRADHKSEKQQLENKIKEIGSEVYALREHGRNKRIAAYKKRTPVRYLKHLLKFCIKPLKYYRFWRDKFIIKKSGLFDYDYYLHKNKDLYTTTVDLPEHYLLYGSREGRNPNPLFDTSYYLQMNPDVKNSGMNPLVHFIKFGWKEGRNPGKNFDTNFYLKTNEDVRRAGINPLLHYLKYGKKEGRLPFHGTNYSTQLDAVERYEFSKSTSGIKYLTGNRIANEDQPNIALVAHLANNNLFGGERSFIDLIEGFSKLKYNIFICIPHLYNKAYTNLLIKHSVKIATLNYKTWNNFNHIDEDVIRSFELLFRENNILAVHVNTIMLREPLIAAKNCGIKSVTHVREIITHDPDLCEIIGKSPEKIVKEVIANSDFIIANSLKTSRIFNFNDKTFILPNTVDVKKLNIPNLFSANRINIALISSNLPKKGIYDFFELASVLEEYTPTAKLLLIGPVNEYIKEFEKKQKKGKFKNVQIKGYINDPLEAIRLSNIVLNLSHFQESFGRTVLEAMAAGRPVVAYNWGAIPELVNDGENGLLVDFKDIKGVARCLNELCNNVELIKTMGQKGRIKAQKCFSESSYAFNLQSAYRKILKDLSEPSDNFNNFYNKAKISVIIPNYNYESYLPERIESIINQTVKPFEIIFLDDCSVDSSVTTAREILAKSSVPYRIIQNERNQGIYSQWLKGAEIAKGDYIWIAEADDYSDKRFLEELIKEFADPQVVISYCQSKVVDSGSNTICMNNLFHTNDLSHFHWLNDYKAVGTRELVDYLFYRNSIPNVSACLFNTEYLVPSMQGIEQYRFCGDWMLYSKLLQTGKVSYVALSLNNFRRHSESTTRKNIGDISYLKEILAVKKLQIQNYPIHKKQIQEFEKYLNRDYQFNIGGLNSETKTFLDFKENIKRTVKKNHRFAIVTTNHNSINGGSEMLWIETAKKLRSRGHDVILIIKEWSPEPNLFEELRSLGIEIYLKNGNEYHNLLKFEPDLLIISTGDQDEGTEWYSFCNEKGIKYCIINHLTKDVKYWPIRKEKLQEVRRGYMQAQKVFFTSWNNHSLMQKRLNQKISNAATFFNPFKVEKNINLPFPDLNDGIKIAMPHRILFIHKGQDLVIKVLSMEKWQKRKIILNLYGDGPDKSKLVNLTKKQGLTNVCFHPRVSDITSIWKNNHIILFSSYMEGQPIILIEAMLCSRVPIATNVGGHNEVIEDNISGFIANEPGVKDIDDALERAYQRRNELEVIGSNARKRVLDYLPEETPEDNFCNKLMEIV